jgi:hypothetical protein
MAISKYPNVPRIPLLYSHQLNYLIELQPPQPPSQSFPKTT